MDREGNGPGVAMDLVGGESQHIPAGGDQAVLSVGVVGALIAFGMETVSVDLDEERDQLAIWRRT